MQNKRVWNFKSLTTGRIDSPEVRKLERITALREYDTFAEAVAAGLLVTGDLYLLGGEVTLYAGPDTEPVTFVNMVMVFNVASPGDTIYHGTGTYTNAIIEWEDGSTVTYNATGSPSHTFSTAGEKLVTVKGVVTNFTFHGTTTPTKLVEVQQFGEQATYAANAFRGCTNLTGISSVDAPVFATTSLSLFFFQCAALEDGDFSTWDVSSITNFQQMFSSCTNFDNSTIGNWDVSAATNMVEMFKTCANFNQSLAGWTWPVGTCNVGGMFQRCYALTDGSWVDLSNASSIAYLFNECSSLNFNINLLDYSNVTSTGFTFADCTSLSPATISLGTLTNATTTAYMFSGCSSLNPTSITFSVPASTSMNDMFLNCTSLTSPSLSITMPASNFTAAELFKGCTSFTGNDIDTLDVSYCTSLSGAFTSTALTTANYDTALAAWAALTVQSGVTLSVLTTTYTDATSRGVLTGTYTWTITDGGFELSFPMESLSSGNLVDESGVRTMTGTGPPTVATGNAPPTATNSIDYANTVGGANTYYHASTSLDLDTALNGKAYFYEVWVNFDDLASTQYVTRLGNFHLSFIVTLNELRLYYNTTNVITLSTTAALSTGTWYHLAAVYQSGTLTAYLNAVSKGTASPSITVTDELYAAYSPHASIPFNGKLSGLRLKELLTTFNTSMLNYA